MVVVGAILVSLPIVLGVYAYGLYPLLLRLAGNSRAPRAGDESERHPLVSIVVPAYNEEQQIRGAIEAMLAQDYPAARRQILIVSDASSDQTDAIVGEYQARGVELLRMPTRGGKTAAENASLARIKGDIVINSDASVRFHPAAVRLLVEGMSDSSVGVASTRDISVTGDSSGNAAEAGYVGYEMRVRSLETAAGGIVGASGSGYAIRVNLHQIRVRADLSRDFSAALTAHRHGLRAISVEDAICYVPRSLSLDREYKRKVRTISRGMETLYFNRDLLNPQVHGAFAWKLLSHKVCRWLVPISAVPAVVGLALLSTRWPLFVVPLVAAFALLALATAGALWPENRPIPKWIPQALLGTLAANLAVLHSTLRFFYGHEDHVWEPTRRAAPLT